MRRSRQMSEAPSSNALVGKPSPAMPPIQLLVDVSFETHHRPFPALRTSEFFPESHDTTMQSLSGTATFERALSKESKADLLPNATSAVVDSPISSDDDFGAA